jgi:hypothetical protein
MHLYVIAVASCFSQEGGCFSQQLIFSHSTAVKSIFSLVKSICSLVKSNWQQLYIQNSLIQRILQFFNHICSIYDLNHLIAYYHTSQASKCHYINTADSLQELRLEKLKLPNVFVYLRSKYESINKSDLIKKSDLVNKS